MYHTILFTGNRKLDISTDGLKSKKEGKSLFLSAKVTESSFHEIDHHLDVCYVMAKVYPQTRINEHPYCVWTLLTKASGEVLNADCHCVSGYLYI